MTMGKNTENYYEILNVRRDCSNKDIKAAYVQLSKIFHPDVKGIKTDSQRTDRFLKIAEAYQTLSKPSLRIEYDKNLPNGETATIYETSSGGSANREFIRRPWEIKPDYDPNPGPYYGIKGLKKTTNFKVALLLLSFGVFGAVFGFTSLKQTVSIKRKSLDDVSAKANEHHQKIRSEVEKYSKNEQLQRLVDRIRSQDER